LRQINEFVKYLIINQRSRETSFYVIISFMTSLWGIL